MDKKRKYTKKDKSYWKNVETTIKNKPLESLAGVLASAYLLSKGNKLRSGIGRLRKERGIYKKFTKDIDDMYNRFLNLDPSDRPSNEKMKALMGLSRGLKHNNPYSPTVRANTSILQKTYNKNPNEKILTTDQEKVAERLAGIIDTGHKRFKRVQKESMPNYLSEALYITGKEAKGDAKLLYEVTGLKKLGNEIRKRRQQTADVLFPTP